MEAANEQPQPGKKPKGGRPKKAVSRNAVMVVRLTPAEKLQIESRAKAAGIKPAAWFRNAAKSAVIKPRFTPEEMGYLRSLAGLANNLNQLVKLAYRNGLLSVGLSLKMVMTSINSLLDKLKAGDR